MRTGVAPQCKVQSGDSKSTETARSPKAPSAARPIADFMASILYAGDVPVSYPVPTGICTMGKYAKDTEEVRTRN